MATTTNLGFQKLTFDYKNELKGSEFNKLLYNIIKPGVYSGLTFTKISDTVISISSGIASINTVLQSITNLNTIVNFQGDVLSYDCTQTNPSFNEVIYLYFEYLPVINNWVEIKHTSSNNINSLPASSVILGEVTYNSGIINSFDYSNRTWGLFNFNNKNGTINDSNIISNTSDRTKQVRLDASNISSSGTRVVSFTDYNYQLNTVLDWQTSRKYYVNEAVIYNKLMYRCNTTHTSSSFTSQSSFWDLIAGGVTYKGGVAASGTVTNQNIGDIYIFTTSGIATNFGGSTVEAGDFAIWNGTTWDIIQRNIDYATTTTSGFVQLSTNNESISGISTTKVVTPSSLTAWADQSNYNVVRKKVFYNQNLSTTPLTITHGLLYNDVMVKVYLASTNAEIVVDVIQNIGSVTLISTKSINVNVLIFS